MDSVFLSKLSAYKKFEASKVETNSPYARYSNQYINADEEQKKWMDKNSDYILSKIKTLESKY